MQPLAWPSALSTLAVTYWKQVVSLLWIACARRASCLKYGVSSEAQNAHSNSVLRT